MRTTALAAAVIASIAALALPQAASANSAVFNDSTGETPGGPDITTVAVSDDREGVITVRADVVGLPAPRTPGAAMFLLNTDENATTGRFGGADYLVFIDYEEMSAEFLRWNGGIYAPMLRAKSPATWTTSPTSVGFVLHRENLGDIQRFELSVMVVRGEPGAFTADIAPDGGFWPYALTPEVDSLSLGFQPDQPRAGKVFAAGRGSIRLTDGSEVRPQAIRCRATLGGKVLKPVGDCRWKLPANARGKTLVVVVHAQYGGEWYEFDPWRFKVR